MIITPTDTIIKVSKKIVRRVYTVGQGKAVVKTTSKQRVLGLRPRRVANVALFNNDSLALLSTDTTTLCTVGVRYRGAEYKGYTVPVVWRGDARDNPRRYIKKADFLALPQLLQDIAAAKGVSVDDSYIIFSRCVAAWAGHNVTDMHVHHVNMDTTDDRLGNLWVMTPSDHASVHAHDTDLLWDADWYEYSSQSMLHVALHDGCTLNDDDMAKALVAALELAYDTADITVGDISSPLVPSTLAVREDPALFAMLPHFV
jgi:hypothetical protein